MACKYLLRVLAYRDRAPVLPRVERADAAPEKVTLSGAVVTLTSFAAVTSLLDVPCDCSVRG